MRQGEDASGEKVEKWEYVESGCLVALSRDRRYGRRAEERSIE